MRKYIVTLALFAFAAAVSAQFSIPGSASMSAALLKPVATGGGGPVWQYTIPIVDATGSDPANASRDIANRVTPATNGTLDKISIYTSAPNGGNIKMAVYSGATTNLMAYGSAVAPSAGGAQDIEITLNTPISVVTTSNYWISFMCDTASGQNWAYKASGGFEIYHFSADYAAAPYDPFGETFGSVLSNQRRIGLHIVP